MEDIYKIDPLTGEQFIPIKSTQRFACPENRIKYGNKKASVLRQERAFLDKHIHKNHIILRKIYEDGKDNIFNCFWLEGYGFRFEAINRTIIYKGLLRNCVYEFILLEIPETDKIKILKNDRF